MRVVTEDPPSTAPREKLTMRFTWRKLWAFTGPGWLMSLAYLDPGNLEADLQQGAYTDLKLVWVLWWSTVIGLVLQEMSARLGCVTGKDLAVVARENYSPLQAKLLYVNMEIAIIGSDIQEVIGSAIALKLLTGGRISLVWGCVLTACDTFTFLAVHYLGVRYLEALICALVATMTLMFLVMWGEAGTSAKALVSGWAVPTIPFNAAIEQAISTVGAVIMPHNLYLHSGLVLSRHSKEFGEFQIDRSNRQSVFEANRYNFVESSGALLSSFFINLAIVAVFARYFFRGNQCAKDSLACIPDSAGSGFDDDGRGAGDSCGNYEGEAYRCGQIGLESAADALKAAASTTVMYLWGVGLLASGQAATMTATFAGQIVMEGFLDLKIAVWKRVAITRAFALGPALCVAIYMGSDSGEFNNVNAWLNILQSVQLPFAMLPVLRLTCMSSIMGEFRTRGMMAGVVTLLALLIVVINFYLLFDFLTTPNSPVPHTSWFACVALAYSGCYLAFLVTLVREECWYGGLLLCYAVGLRRDKPQVPAAYAPLPEEGGGGSASQVPPACAESGATKVYARADSPLAESLMDENGRLVGSGEAGDAGTHHSDNPLLGSDE